MRRARPAAHRASLAVLAVATAASLAASPAAGKMGLLATLEAPIAMDSPPGEILLVGATVVAPDDATGETVPVIGTPVYLALTGRWGATTRAAAEGTRIDGYYRFHIEVPAGGPRAIEMGVHGSSSDGPLDLPMLMAADPFTFGPIREGTAQPASVAEAAPAAPEAPAAPAVTIPPRAASALPEAAAAPGTSSPAADGLPSWMVLVAFGGVLAVLALGGLAAARSRGARGPHAPGTARDG